MATPKKKSDSTISVYGAEELKKQIKFLITFNHPDNGYYGSTESRVAKRFLNYRRTINEEYQKIKRLEENDLFN